MSLPTVIVLGGPPSAEPPLAWSGVACEEVLVDVLACGDALAADDEVADPSTPGGLGDIVVTWVP